MNILSCELKNGEVFFSKTKIETEKKIKVKKNYLKTQIGVRPEFVNFSDSGIPAKVLKVSNAGRHQIVDVECSGGKLKMISSAATNIPSENVYLKFNSKYTHVYGDDWIIEE